MMLAVEDLHVGYGNIRALKGVSLSIKQGQVVAILGANGAGKTTLLKTLSGILRPSSGQIVFKDQVITNLTPSRLVELGIAQVPEGREIFGPLTVLENLELGAYHRYRKAKRDQLEADFEFVYSLFPILRDRLKQQAGTLSGGEQQMLALGRALMSRPRLLLLDEPSLGLAPKVIEAIFEVLRSLRERGLTILLVEQDAKIALDLADEGYVLRTGVVALHDTSENLMHGGKIENIYLGKDY